MLYKTKLVDDCIILTGKMLLDQALQNLEEPDGTLQYRDKEILDLIYGYVFTDLCLDLAKS